MDCGVSIFEIVDYLKFKRFNYLTKFINMSFRKYFFVFLSFLALALTNRVFAIDDTKDTPKPEVGIEEKLGQIIPEDMPFFDENGKTVHLKELTGGKPAIITLVYFRCPGICSPLLNGLTNAIDILDLDPVKDYNIITISFDPREDYELAAEKKKNYLNLLKKKKIDPMGWRFLTADSSSIKRITDAVGFRYQKQGEDYMHGAAITVISPEGKIVRYLYGTEFLPFDLKMSLIEASEGRVGTTIAKVMKFCFSYDPEGRRYALNVTRIAGGGILFLLAVFVLILTVKKKKTL